MKKSRLLILLSVVAFTLGSCGEPKEETNQNQSSEIINETLAQEPIPSEQPKETEAPKQEEITFDVAGIAELYQDYFPIGVAIPDNVFKNEKKYKDLIVNNYNQVTCENETKPDYILDRDASQADLPNSYLRAAVRFDRCAPAIKFCLENNMQLKLHTLVWHSQTPKWFFTEDYTDNGALVSREVMLARMENYIADVLNYFQDNYPGLLYSVDVVNEAFDVGNGDENGIRKVDNKWYDTVGPDYYYQAFVFANKYASEDLVLYYNDYGCMHKVDLMLERLAQAKEEGLIDGIGMQGHLSTSDKMQYGFVLALKNFCKAGYQVQITELDIGVSEQTENAFLTQARKYRVLFSLLKEAKEEGYAINGVTLWGLSDGLTWRSEDYPLLFDKDLNPKKAYYGVMQHSSIANVE